MTPRARFMLDTDICVFVHRRGSASLLRRFEALSPGEAVISAVTWGELSTGAAKSRDKGAVLAALDEFALLVGVAPLSRDAAALYGRIRADLERRGAIIGANDLWIAAHAASLGLALVTNNTREFGRVKGLKIENWK